MDKITRIHLAKIPYEIGIDAQAELKKYLDEIRDELDADLADEIMTDIEVRITEILSDRKINRNDVITNADIDAIQEQLGSPEQFTDSEAEGQQRKSGSKSTKKLLRDTDNAYIGGVASGISAYFSIDPIFIRLIFIALIFASGLGIVLYILLWVLVPPAKTNSEKLLMKGEPATAAALQRYRNTAERTIANLRLRSALRVLYKIFRVLFTIGTAVFVVALLSSIGFGSAILYTQPLHQPYVTYHLNYLLLGLIWLFAMTIIGLLIVILLRLWRQRSSSLKIAFVALVSILVLTLAGVAVVSPFVVDHYKDLYAGNKLVTALPVDNNTPSVRPISLSLSADNNLVVSYIVSSQPLHAAYKAYPGMHQPNISIVNKNGTINVAAQQLTQVVPSCVLNWCHSIYLPVRITLYGPALQRFTVNGPTELDINNVVQSSLTLLARNNANMSVNNSYSSTINIGAQSGSSINASDATSQTSTITAQNGTYVFGPASNTVTINVPIACEPTLIELAQTPTAITLNGQSVSAQNISQNGCISLDDPSPYSGYIFRGPPANPPAPPITLNKPLYSPAN